MFNLTELHFSEVTSFKIGTLISILKIRFYGKDNVGVTDRFIFTGDNKEDFGDAIRIFLFCKLFCHTIMNGNLGNGLPLWL